jgi:hypothetical protein
MPVQNEVVDENEKEDKFIDYVENRIKDKLPANYILEKYANLFYQITLDNNLNLMVNLDEEPKRGHLAFQTDLCIFLRKENDKKIPKIVIEFKNALTTHDIITYSNKARRHKQVYPYLRYGLISYNISTIPKRFFLHNESLDFYLALKDHSNNIEVVLLDLIEKELEISSILESTIFGDCDYDYFRTNIEFKKI